MKGDFTRFTFQPEKHYTSVRMQQGRLQLDSDWNEQVDIQNHLRQTQTVDFIGTDSGVPTSQGDSKNPYRDSFKITVIRSDSESDSESDSDNDLALAPGRLYVSGTLCELEGTLFDFNIVPENSDSCNKIKVSTLKVDGRNLEKDQWVAIDTNPKNFFRITNVDLEKLELQLSSKITESSGKMRRILTYKTQPDYPNPDNGRALENGIYLAYIDVWQRNITTIEDPKLREVALINTPDTTTRTQTVWQLKLYDPIEKYFEQLIEGVVITLEEREKLLLALKKMIVTRSKNTVNGGQLLELFNPEKFQTNGGKDRVLKKWTLLLKKITDYQNDSASFIKEEWANFLAEHKSRLAYMNACAGLCGSAGATSNDRGYQRLENQLYRVEIHDSGKVAGENNTEKTATFKWSRENGSIVSAIEKIEGNIITIPKSNQDAWTNSQTGQWLEITNEEMELKGKPGVMVRLLSASYTKIEFDRSSITNDRDSILLNPTQLKVRRWENITKEPAISTKADWIILEAGIMVKFNPKSYYETGDYWLIPARSATNDIEWPNDQADKKIRQPLEQLRQGIHHDYCPLAIVEVKGGKFELKEDLRVIFPPLMRCADKSEVESQFSAVNSTLETKANQSEVESQFSAVNSTLETKANQSEVESQFSAVNSTLETKANRNEVENRFSAVESTLETKANQSEVDRQFSAVNSTLETKANQSEVDRQFSAVNSTLETKANQSEVDRQFSAVNSTLETKANQSEVESQFSAVNSTLETKANQSEVESQFSDVNSILETKANQNGDPQQDFNAKIITAQEIKVNKLTQNSSNTLKEDIQDLSSQEVAAILRSLNPVKFIYKEDETQTINAGFIADNTPDLLTANDKQAIKVVDIVAVLTKAVQDNRKTLADLVKIVKKQQAEIATLKQKIKTLEEKTEQ
ncbi:DUF6519 domain-containing protein [Capilliphycus salinus ALCB114379]|uniref:DUF6519 domain-containing protein n=1 Tax=Capilliphycus salinus TaxID=2768948 RepID=UPI0039A49947